MPIVDVQLVAPRDAPADPGLAQRVADALGATFGAAPGRVWVRVARLDRDDYAENGVAPDGDAMLPVFVDVLHAVPPEGDARAEEAARIAAAVAAATSRGADRVHVGYAPAGRGRIAFGGVLLR